MSRRYLKRLRHQHRVAALTGSTIALTPLPLDSHVAAARASYADVLAAPKPWALSDGARVTSTDDGRGMFTPAWVRRGLAKLLTVPRQQREIPAGAAS